jgi:tripeptide aminopeptidase
MDLFKKRKQAMVDLVADFNEKYGADAVELKLTDQYYNMREKVEPVMHIVDVAEQAMMNLGITPNVKAIRGGTDGSRLSYMGLPCPNIFAGGHNFHGRYEFLPILSLVKAKDVIKEIVRLIAE